MRTHQYREVILSACTCCHLSAEEIFEKIRQSHPRVGRATIYRNIDQLSQEGFLRKIPWVNGKAYYEYNHVPHAHLVDDKTKIFCDFPINNVAIKNIPEWYEIAEICIFIKKS